MSASEDHVIWHDLECGGYSEDLPLWRQLAKSAGGPVLDVGAGTGRVSLDLARAWTEITALDSDWTLLAALETRARRDDLVVSTIVADARKLEDLAAITGVRYALVLVPMQTLQLLGGPDGRAEFYAGARALMRPGALLAAALAEALDPFEAGEDGVVAPLPDMRDIDGVVYASRPIAVRTGAQGATIVRVREVVARDGSLTDAVDEITLDRADPASVAEEAAPHGFEALAPTRIEATDEHVGSEVVILRAT